MTEMAVSGTGYHLTINCTEFLNTVTKCNDFSWADKGAKINNDIKIITMKNMP